MGEINQNYIECSGQWYIDNDLQKIYDKENKIFISFHLVDRDWIKKNKIKRIDLPEDKLLYIEICFN